MTEKQRPLDVLVVDNDEHDLNEIRAAAMFGDMVLHCVGSRDEALCYLHRRGRYSDARRPQLVVLDGSTSDFHGFDLLEALKADSGLCTIPVVVLTDHDGDFLPSYNGAQCSVVMKPMTVGRARQFLTG